jgi:hypothetical protein
MEGFTKDEYKAIRIIDVVFLCITLVCASMLIYTNNLFYFNLNLLALLKIQCGLRQYGKRVEKKQIRACCIKLLEYVLFRLV